MDPHLPINFVHDEISKLLFIYYYLGLGWVKTLAGPSAAAAATG